MARCPYDPVVLLGAPVGQLHCPRCGCMVIAGLEHGPCIEEDCEFFDAVALRELEEAMRGHRE